MTTYIYQTEEIKNLFETGGPYFDEHVSGLHNKLVQLEFYKCYKIWKDKDYHMKNIYIREATECINNIIISSNSKNFIYK